MFVLERMSDGAPAGPSGRGAAMLVGHSTTQWLNWYNLKTVAQGAVHALQK